jgi:antitoxin component of RelBE/YafQ-DinJ toxin-antitoxin module
MSRKKLTLSVDERLTWRAKAIADRRGTSVSRLVETFFTSLEQGELGREEGRPLDAEQAETSEGEPGEDTARDLPADYEPSEWARQWRGAFAQEGKAYPDDTRWEEGVLAEEIEKKHAS